MWSTACQLLENIGKHDILIWGCEDCLISQVSIPANNLVMCKLDKVASNVCGFFLMFQKLFMTYQKSARDSAAGSDQQLGKHWTIPMYFFNVHSESPAHKYTEMYLAHFDGINT